MREIELEEIKNIELAILKYIDHICRENKIEYFLTAGSLIGAIRHKGIIPWDDDIDIGLKRENYNKLIEILKNDENSQYFLMDYTTQTDYFYPYAKLVDKRTVLQEKVVRKISNYGIFVDIFAYDTLPDDACLRDKRYNKQKKIQRQIVYYATKEVFGKNKLKRLLEVIYKKYCEILGIGFILKKYNKICMQYNNADGQDMISNWPTVKKDEAIQKKEYFNQVIDWEFDGLKIKIPEKYDSFLTNMYGDYMTLPSEEERNGKHNMKAYWKE